MHGACPMRQMGVEMDDRSTLTRYEFDVLTHCLSGPDRWIQYLVTRHELIRDGVIYDRQRTAPGVIPHSLTGLGVRLYESAKQNPRALPDRL